MSALFLLALAWACFRPLLSGERWMTFVEDDFFYYLKIALNLSHGLGSTFNGIVATNGYHPLWLLLLTALCRVSTSPVVIVRCVLLISFLAAALTYLLAKRLFERCAVPSLPAALFAGLATAFCAPMLFRGMEVTLAIPLMLAVMLFAVTERWRKSWRGAACFGLLISLLGLSRLDSLLFALPLAGLLFGSEPADGEESATIYAGLALGLSPLLLYVVSNVLLFGTLLPISGMAKQLKLGISLSRPAIESAFGRSWYEQAIDLLLLGALLSLLLLWRRVEPNQRAVLLCALLFPFAYVVLLSARSDWPLWDWYLYAFRPALCAALLVFWQMRPVRAAVMAWPGTLALLALLLVTTAQIRWNTAGRDSLVDAAEDIEHFARTHHGVYAMGDRSGAVGYLLRDPVVQTEGLVMDRRFLDAIRHRSPLPEVLSLLHVDYYVGSSRQPLRGCFHAVEPQQAGPASPVMTGDFCAAPLAAFHHSHTFTYIYSLKEGSSP